MNSSMFSQDLMKGMPESYPVDPLPVEIPEEDEIVKYDVETHVSALKRLPKEFKSAAKRNKLVSQAIDYILLHENDSRVKTLNLRRKRLMGIYQNEPRQQDETDRNQGVHRIEVPTSRPRIRARVAAMLESVSSLNPIFTVSGVTKTSKIEGIQKALQLACDNIDFKSIIKDIIELPSVQMTCFVRVMLYIEEDGFEFAAHNGKFVGPVVEVIPAEQFVVWPLQPGHIKNKRLYGHKFDMSAYQIEQYQRAGMFLPVSMTGKLEPSTKVANDSMKPDGENDGTSHNFENVVLHDIVFDYVEPDKAPIKVRMVLCKDTSKVYYIETYNRKIPLYTKVQFENDPECFLARTCSAHDMQTIQVLIDNLISQLYHRSKLGTSPPLLSMNKLRRTRDAIGWDPGEVVQTMDPNARPLASNTNINEIMATVALLLQMLEAGSQTPNSVAGSSSGGDQTATENNIRFQSFARATSIDVVAISRAFSEIAKMMAHTLWEGWDEFVENYDDGSEDLAWLRNVDWTVKHSIDLTGDSPQNTAEIQMNAALTAMQVLMGQLPESMKIEYLTVLPDLIEAIIQSLPLPQKSGLTGALEKLKPTLEQNILEEQGRFKQNQQMQMEAQQMAIEQAQQGAQLEQAQQTKELLAPGENG